MSSKRECPSCRTAYIGEDKLFCPKDGTRLMDPTPRSPVEDPLVGRVIAGRFVLERRLGKGGMGVVYLANHNVLKRMFAVKLLRREFVSNERALARFFREARVASSVDHPNIVSIYDYGQTDKGEPYLVMEYVEGTLLYLAVVESKTRNLTPLAAVDIALQVARALEHAHERGVVHRDIKPENILITTFNGQSDWVKVLDFGVARIVGQPPLTRIGEEIIGTPEFIAPEMMAATSEVAPAVDLYALGIMLHDTIVGEPPFRGEIKEVLHGHLNIVPKPLSERRLDASIPSELDELTMQLLLKDPYILDFLDLNDRYLEKDLEDAILRDIEQFLLELGSGFSFIARQKRIQIDEDDFYIDLLFYNRKLKRLVAIDLKTEKFRHSHKSQMELYLRWLAKYEQEEGENPPLGIIFCTSKKHEQIELLDLEKSDIHVAEYMTVLPPKEVLEQRLHLARERAKQRLLADGEH